MYYFDAIVEILTARYAWMSCSAWVCVCVYFVGLAHVVAKTNSKNVDPASKKTRKSSILRSEK